MRIEALSGWTSEQRHVVAACFLGWTLDAFDFFLLVFVLKDIAQEFNTQITEVTFAILLTLAMRPVGAYLFGRAADRWGRRPALMVNILLYLFIEFASGFAPSLTVLLVLRAIFGIAMGGEWGVGASLTMESIPPHARGLWVGLAAIGLSDRILPGVDRLRRAVPVHRMARHVHGWGHSGASRFLYPPQCSGIA
jgi:SHS family lactate transporter-like MFS transporter